MNDKELKQIDSLLTKRLGELRVEMGTFIENRLIPLIDEKASKEDLKDLARRSDVERLERRLDAHALKVNEQDIRLDRIESVPVIAHQIKSKK